MQVFTGLPISQGLAAGKIIFLGTQETVVRQAGSPQEEQARFAAAQQQAQGYHWYTFTNVHRAPSVIPKFPGWPAADALQPPPA